MIKVLVIGETCQDKFIYCETSRFSPEAPVPVLNPIETIENEGMSGNVVRNLQSLERLSIKHIHQIEKIIKTRFVEKKSNHMFIRVDEGEKKISRFDRNINISDFDIVVVSDYHKGFLSDEDLIYIGINSKLSILDSKRRLNNDIIQSYDFVKLNESEYKNNQDLIISDNVIVTLGSKGSMYKDKLFSSPNPQETIDVSGAGDTFTSAFITKFYKTKNVEESIIWANKMSAIVVSKRGVATPCPLEDLNTFL
jgi:bifunctional ADP-heptose synthase (sugar kinase/adenylyltransferase)